MVGSGRPEVYRRPTRAQPGRRPVTRDGEAADRTASGRLGDRIERLEARSRPLRRTRRCRRRSDTRTPPPGRRSPRPSTRRPAATIAPETPVPIAVPSVSMSESALEAVPWVSAAPRAGRSARAARRPGPCRSPAIAKVGTASQTGTAGMERERVQGEPDDDDDEPDPDERVASASARSCGPGSTTRPSRPGSRRSGRRRPRSPTGRATSSRASVT